MVGVIAGGVGLSQFPEYAQQYEQRLGGAVDALQTVVADFDQSASSAGLTREQALASMEGSAFLDSRQGDMTRTIARYDRLSGVLTQMQLRGDIEQVLLAPRLTDPEIAREAFAAYEPAVPVTVDALTFAAIGAVIGGLIIVGLRGLIAPLLRRRA